MVLQILIVNRLSSIFFIIAKAVRRQSTNSLWHCNVLQQWLSHEKHDYIFICTTMVPGKINRIFVKKLTIQFVNVAFVYFLLYLLGCRGVGCWVIILSKWQTNSWMLRDIVITEPLQSNIACSKPNSWMLRDNVITEPLQSNIACCKPIPGCYATT
jgi:hypothetical protein